MRPRRFVRPERPAEPKTRINEAIRAPNLRVVDENGEQVGIKTRDEAIELAHSRDLHLVEVAPTADPPVCRIMDYGKYRYEQEQKAKVARKHQTQINVKEIKFRPKIGVHDYETKKGHVVRFLKDRAKVKVTIMFRGREASHPERGRALLMRLAEDVQDLGVIESQPLLDGRNMVMVLGPHRNVQQQTEADAPAAEAAPAPATATTEPEAQSA